MSHQVLWGLPMAGAGMPDEREPWVTSDEVCMHLRISTNTLTRWISSRGMPHRRVGRSLRFRIAEVDAWIESGKAAEGRGEDQQ